MDLHITEALRGAAAGRNPGPIFDLDLTAEDVTGKAATSLVKTANNLPLAEGEDETYFARIAFVTACADYVKETA